MSSPERVLRCLRRPLVRGAALALALALAGCSAGTDDEGDGDEDVGILASYQFRLGGPLAGEAGPSVLHVTSSGYQVSARMDLGGSFLCDQETEICRLQTVDPGSALQLDDATVPELVGDFTVAVEEIWVFNPALGDRPVAGSARIDPAAPDLEDVVVRVATCEPGGPGVTVRSGGGGSTCYPWTELDALLDGDPEPAQLLAAFGWSAIEFTLAQARYTLEMFSYLERGGAGMLPCDTYRASWPGGPTNPGWLTLSWLDDNPNGDVGPGDSFRQELTGCWSEEPGTDAGTLLDGLMEFAGYTEVVQRGMITRIGFEGVTLASRVGGVAYRDLTVTETHEEAGTIIPGDPLLLNGQHVIVFWD